MPYNGRVEPNMSTYSSGRQLKRRLNPPTVATDWRGSREARVDRRRLSIGMLIEVLKKYSIDSS